MDVIVTSLEALIQRATSPQNPGPDKAAVDAFCGMVNKEPGYTHVAARLIITKIQSLQEWEALQGLAVLEACMNKCGPGFHAEVGKFRFLNEMIKLVSPKYLGDQTSPGVRQRMLHLMFSWTIEYPQESKIKEAYQMLRRQGVVTDEVPLDTSGSVDVSDAHKNKSSVFEDERKSRLLQKLLQSKNPDDIQAANRLIKTMVKEDERRVEIRSRRATELEVAHNNAQLLNEMLNCYTPGPSSSEDLALIGELREGCERCKTQLIKDLRPQDCLYEESAEVVEKLNKALAVYDDVVVGGNVRKNRPSESDSTAPSLLDLSSPQQDMLGESGESARSTGISSKKSDLDALSDIFGCNVGGPPQETSIPALHTLEPTAILTNLDNACAPATSEKTGAARALDDLNALGESLLKQSLSQGNCPPQTSRPSGKIPMNQIGRAATVPQPSPLDVLNDIQKKEESSSAPLDLDFLSNSVPPASPSVSTPTPTPASTPSPAPAPGLQKHDSNVDELLNGDDAMVDLSMDEPPSPSATTKSSPVASAPPAPPPATTATTATTATEVKSLADISIVMDNLKPASVPPCTALDDNGMSIVIYLAEGIPRPDVTVYVVTTISKQKRPLSNYGFQAVVPKGCKLRLLPPSGLELPPHNPFLPPAAITQVMLIANPAKVALNLKFILSYTMEDETVTEMGSVESLPTLS